MAKFIRHANAKLLPFFGQSFENSKKDTLATSIAQILWTYDIANIGVGNEMEYKIEAEAIYIKLSKCTTPDDVRALLINVFNYWFGHNWGSFTSDLEKRMILGVISREIWALKSKTSYNRSFGSN